MHFVKEIIEAKPYKLLLKFEDNSIRMLDLETKLKQWSKTKDSIFKPLLEPLNFLKVNLNKELETIYWDNGVDFSPEMLYEWSEIINISDGTLYNELDIEGLETKK